MMKAIVRPSTVFSVLRSSGGPRRKRLLICKFLVIVLLIAGYYYLASSVFQSQSQESTLDFQDLYNRENFTILANFFPSSEEAKNTKSLTYAVYSEYYDLRKNLIELVHRWKGFVSVAIYAPDHDFSSTVNEIEYLQRCTNSEIKRRVSFHIFFENAQAPTTDVFSRLDEDMVNCTDLKPPLDQLDVANTRNYRLDNNLHFPISLARNIARENAQTDFVLSGEINLIPLPSKLAEEFGTLSPTLEAKSILLIPVRNETSKQNEGVKISLRKFEATKIGTLKEDFYFIGSKDIEPFDETFIYNIKINRRSIIYHLCLLHYTFYILDGAYLLIQKGDLEGPSQELKMSSVETRNYEEAVKYKYLRMFGGSGAEECGSVFGTASKTMAHAHYAPHN